MTILNNILCLWMRTSQSSVFSSPFSHVTASPLETMRRFCRSSRVENSGVALRGHLRAGLLFFTTTFLLGFKRDDTMARTRCLVSSPCHLIPSVSLAPFHFSTYLPRSANHISVRRVTCFPVLQQPTLHDALQQIYQLVLTSPRGFSVARDFGYIQPNASFFLRAWVTRPRSPSHPPPPLLHVLSLPRRIRNVTC